uniref:DUF5727 domain-containing protein n=1 Tax=Schistocephalus solidus TaxID=70667 RepID=A0A0X3Q4D1_SCHSO
MPFAIWLICVALASAEPEIRNVFLIKSMDFEFCNIVAASRKVLENPTWANGTSMNPCAAPKPCIQFFSPKRSLHISGKLKSGYAAITLIPEKPTLPAIAVIMLQGNEWFPELPGVQFVTKLDLPQDFSGTRILEFNEDIKDIILHGEIKAFSPFLLDDDLQVLRPYEQNNEPERMLMRVTGRMEIEYQSFTLTGGPRGAVEYVLMPSEELNMPINIVHIFDWPEGCN